MQPPAHSPQNAKSTCMTDHNTPILLRRTLPPDRHAEALPPMMNISYFKK